MPFNFFLVYPPLFRPGQFIAPIMKLNIGITFSTLILTVFALNSCVGYGRNQEEEQLTVGTVQKKIHKGLSSVKVAKRLGSPNIVKGDSKSGETWIYDKISSRVQTKHSDQYGTLLLIGGSSSSSSVEHSTHTLTIVIEFDKQNRVETFSYHRSKF